MDQMQIDLFFMDNPFINYSILFIVCFFLFIRVYRYLFPIREGIKMPKFPSVDDIKDKVVDGLKTALKEVVDGMKNEVLNALLTPVRIIDAKLDGLLAIIKGSFTKLGTMIKGSFTKLGKTIKESFTNLGKMIATRFKKFGEMFMKVMKTTIKQITAFGKMLIKVIVNTTKIIVKQIMEIIKKLAEFTYIFTCAIRLIMAFPSCFIFYCLDVIGKTFYLPFSILFWAVGATKEEAKMWRVIYSIDTMIYEPTGYHIFHYSESIMNKCYRCKQKPEKTEKKSTILDPVKIEPDFDSSGDETDKLSSSSETIGNIILMIFIIIVSAFIITYLVSSVFGIAIFSTTLSMDGIKSFIKNKYTQMVHPEQMGSDPVSNGAPPVPNGTPLVPTGTPLVPNGTPLVPNGTPLVPTVIPSVPNVTPLVQVADPVQPQIAEID